MTIYNMNTEFMVDGKWRNSFFCEETKELFVIENKIYTVVVENYSDEYKKYEFKFDDFCEENGFDINKVTMASNKIIKIYENNL